MTGHACEHPDAPEGAIWRCHCGQLWQLSIAQDRWIVVDPEAERVLRAILEDLP